MRWVWILTLALTGLPVVSTWAADDQQSINQACSAEADRLGLHGPERYDFRARCTGRGVPFAKKQMSAQCKQVIVENGIAGRAAERIKVLQAKGAKALICQQVALMQASLSKAVASLDADPQHCGYPPATIEQLRSNLDRVSAPCTGQAPDAGI